MAKAPPDRLVPEMAMTHFAQVIGIAHSIVGSYIAEGMPHEVRGKSKIIQVPKAYKWIVEKHRQAGRDEVLRARGEEPSEETEGDSMNRRLLVAKLRKEEAAAELNEAKAAKMRGELWERDEAISVMGELVSELASALDSLPGQFSLAVAAAANEGEARLILEEESRRMRDNMAAVLRRAAETHAVNLEDEPEQ